MKNRILSGTSAIRRRRRKVIGMLIAFVLLWLSLVFLIIPGVKIMEHYNRVYENPLCVEATVTNNKAVDDGEGHTEYESYITYVVNGVTYQGVHYKTVNRQEQLTDIGQIVSVEVSPEDPGVLVSKMLGRAGGYLMMGLILFTMLFSAECTAVLRSRCTRGLVGAPDDDIIERDAKWIIWSNPWNYIFFYIFSLALFCWLRYGAWVHVCVGIVAIVAGVLLAVCLFVALHRSNRVRNREWELRADKLVRKDKVSGGDEGDTYYLYFQSDDKDWKTATTEADYNATQVGACRWVVHLKGRKKPIVYYDVYGDATTT